MMTSRCQRVNVFNENEANLILEKFREIETNSCMYVTVLNGTKCVFSFFEICQSYNLHTLGNFGNLEFFKISILDLQIWHNVHSKVEGASLCHGPQN